MITRRYPSSYNYKKEYKQIKIFSHLEGSVQYTAIKNDRYYFIIDSTTMIELIPEIEDSSISITEFDDKEIFYEFLKNWARKIK